jgi:hypothetical protein
MSISGGFILVVVVDTAATSKDGLHSSALPMCCLNEPTKTTAQNSDRCQKCPKAELQVTALTSLST